MTDAELKVGLAFHGISCIAAFAILLYMRRKARLRAAVLGKAACGRRGGAARDQHQCLARAAGPHRALLDLWVSGKVKVRDVWAHADKGTASGALTATVPPYDSLFYVLTPAKN